MEEEKQCSNSTVDHHLLTQETHPNNGGRGAGDTVTTYGGHGGSRALSFFKSMFFNQSANQKTSFRRRRIKGMEEQVEDEIKGNIDIINIDSAAGKGGLSLPIPHLSPLAYNVISRCSKIIHASAEDLYHSFDKDLPDKVKQPSTCARNFIEFCSYQAIRLSIAGPDYLSDKEFRRLMFDMMLAWESSGVNSDQLVTETACDNNPGEDEDGYSLFYSSSTNMAVQVDDKNTVGQEAFTRIAPACFIVADIITVHNLFDVLTRSSSHRLHYLIFDKYLRSLEKVIKTVNNGIGAQFFSSIPLVEGEIILDVDGTVPTQPVLQHIGRSAWPGRLTLTNYALYFEPGIGIYDKAVRYDLATDTKQVIKPELTGPLGARLFDKAVMYKSTSMYVL
ncbi:OLC1v1033384C1 [Oldenlandia corymbosa var. corymbosa]|uniref:OLC1v1033384C1 n=1 Tax=Oldenlandia corymbosa var. corymbosa TaxID=529605 RepID=A0AAV1CN80_OLDCO|nr:OLC1v1033384C1 [Oldenlandia corymbosa var. corymbosa]